MSRPCMRCAEERARRLAVEQELEAMADLCLRTEPLIRHVERRVYKPMPPQIIFVRPVERIIDRPVERIVDRPVLIDVPGHAYERPAGFFGRLGDRLDRMFRSAA